MALLKAVAELQTYLAAGIVESRDCRAVVAEIVKDRNRSARNERVRESRGKIGIIVLAVEVQRVIGENVSVVAEAAA